MALLTGLQVDQRVLQDLLSEKLPKLMAHLGQHRVDLSFITFNWFLVVFADSLISNILLQVWDAFLYEGTKVGCCWRSRGWGRGPGQSWASALVLWVLSLPLENGRTVTPVRAVAAIFWERGFVNCCTHEGKWCFCLQRCFLLSWLEGGSFLWRGSMMTQKAHPYSARCPSCHLGPSFSSSCYDRALNWEVGT